MTSVPVSFSKQEYADLLKALEIAHGIAASVDESYKNYEMLHRRFDGLTEIVLEAGVKVGAESVHQCEHGSETSEEIINYVDKVIGDYDEEYFWGELKRRLSERDFTRTLSPSERRQLVSGHGDLPPRAKSIYDSYDSEFRRHGINHLRIDERD